jgi:(5-formylfuran-3-yl)methyl phosphate synthase
MTRMLTSVNSLDEARLVLAEHVDIIDLKNPAMGALGGLDIQLVKNIVEIVNGQCPTSATIGDLPMQAELVFNAVTEMAKSGVNYVKIGLFPNGDVLQVIDKLGAISNITNLIAVLFADTNPDFSIIDSLKVAGFSGVMLDTLDKTKGSLTMMITKSEIERFVNLVKSKDLICGLAGTLRLEDIPVLLPFKPHYLGFRGALCDHHERTAQINTLSVRRLKQAIDDFSI